MIEKIFEKIYGDVPLWAYAFVMGVVWVAVCIGLVLATPSLIRIIQAVKVAAGG
jgi:hypothetical protein